MKLEDLNLNRGKLLVSEINMDNGGLLLSTDQYDRGLVVRSGPAREDELEIKEGSYVLYTQFQKPMVTLNGEQYCILDINNVVAFSDKPIDNESTKKL